MLFRSNVFSLEHGGLMAEIDEFFVLPGARGQGAGGQLLEAAELALRQRGCLRVQLQLGVKGPFVSAVLQKLQGEKQTPPANITDVGVWPEALQK